MSEPLRVVFEVACEVDHRFATWTDQIGTWWPPDHTLSGAPTAVVLEGHVGGRIYERSPQGEEHDWGVVTVWRPPEQLSYRWHLGVGPDAATDVEVRFTHLDRGNCMVEIVQSGWERLGAAGPDARNRNRVGWESLLPHLQTAIDKGA